MQKTSVSQRSPSCRPLHDNGGRVESLKHFKLIQAAPDRKTKKKAIKIERASSRKRCFARCVRIDKKTASEARCRQKSPRAQKRDGMFPER